MPGWEDRQAWMNPRPLNNLFMMTGTYDFRLVTLSVAIAMLSAYTALDLGGRLVATQGWQRLSWLGGGATLLGTGIWSMHFIGMLAFNLPVPVNYHILTVLLSILPAILASGLALFMASQSEITRANLLGAGCLMGLGIAAMHYIGMAAMRLPATLQYKLPWVVLSVVIAMVVSMVALWMVSSFNKAHTNKGHTGSGLKKLGGSLLMGVAIPIMHYIGMAAVQFSPSHLASWPATAPNTDWLSTLVGTLIFTLLGAGLLISLETKVSERTQQLVTAMKQLQQSQLKLVQSEKMSALGNLMAGVAHEINNPVGFIAGNLYETRQSLGDLIDHVNLYRGQATAAEIQDHAEEIELDYLLDELPKMLASMQAGCDRIKDISHSLRIFSRADSDQKQTFDLHAGIDSTILILRHRLKANYNRPGIEVVTDYGEMPSVNCYPGPLNQVFMNILSNAIDALDEANKGRRFAEIKAHPNRITVRTQIEENWA
ncbi:MAG: MHYT domain-containing protein, partial [Cyanobacteria bacterium P01_F01_bin.4]